MKILHILNGDSTLAIFENAGIEGDTLVWREVLCEGPCLPQLGTDAFWEQRQHFFHEYFSVDENDYKEKTIREFEKLEKLADYDEVVLWFEYDLYCQINFMAIMAWMEEHAPDGIQLSMVCTGKVTHDDKLHTLGEFSAEVYPDFFRDRARLTKHDLAYAQMVWSIYCSTEHQMLLPSALEQHLRFPYLKGAMKAHCLRFPNYETGLNEIEAFVLTKLRTGTSNPHTMVRQLLEREDYYGFGDMQYYQILKGLEPILEIGLFRLNEQGKAILVGEAHFDDFREQHYSWGGTGNKAFYWDGGFESLLKRFSV